MSTGNHGELCRRSDGNIADSFPEERRIWAPLFVPLGFQLFHVNTGEKA